MIGNKSVKAKMTYKKQFTIADKIIDFVYLFYP